MFWIILLVLKQQNISFYFKTGDLLLLWCIISCFICLYTEMSPKFLGLFKLFYNILDMAWICMVCSLMLLLVLIAIINVFHVQVFKMKWNSQKYLIGKSFLSFFTRQEKNLRCNSQKLKFNALWLIFSKFICQYLINISWRKFSISIEEIYFTSSCVLQLFPGFFVSLFSFMFWFKLPDFSQPESGCEQFVLG